MNVIIDLIEAYSEHISLPMMLIKINGQIEYSADHYKMGNHLLFEEKQRYINKIKKVADTLKVPTVMSVSNDNNRSDTFYIVTPLFELNDDVYFVAAGHFYIRSTFGILKAFNPESNNNFYDEYEIDDILKKINNFFQLLLSKVEIKRKMQKPTNLEKVLNSISNLNFHESNDKTNINIKLILDEYVKINNIDFIGYAVKDSNDAFSIVSIAGENVSHIIDKKFYIGEGILGKAAIIGEDFYWHTEENAKRNEFLHRYGIFPNQLFGFTLQDNGGGVSKIVFCGSFSKKMIDNNVNQFLKCLIQLTVHRNQKNSNLIDVALVQNLFTNWIDFVDIASSNKDKQQIIVKILDLCQTLNLDNFTCVTTSEYEFLYRGKSTAISSDAHQLAFKQLQQNPHLRLWINEHYIHYAVEIGTKKGLNLFTICFTKETNMHYMTNVFEMIGTLISNECIAKNSTNHNAVSIFDILFQSMEDMNEEKYRSATIACNLISKIHHILSLDTYIYNKLINICKVMPYSMDLLRKYISKTDEWIILEQYKYLKETNRLMINQQIEYQLIAFIDDIILHHGHFKYINYMEKELKDLCYSFYMKYETDDVDTDLNVGKSKEADEQQSQLRNVINTLDLTLREKEVLSLIIEGMNNNEVGELLKISSHTVKNHVTNIFKKLDVSDRMQATAKVYRIRFGTT